MEFSTTVLLSLITLALIHSSLATNTPQDYLTPQNAARSKVRVGPLRWDTKVKAYAQAYANKMAATCMLVHSHGPYGENLAKSTGNDLNATGAVKLWVDEKKYYNYATNKCTPGQQCLHYTQVVWRNTSRVGCARVPCRNGGTFITCNYAPPGNYIGQRPY